MKSTKYSILFIALCLFSCNEDYDEFGGTPVLNIDQTNGNSEAFIENFGNSISRNFLGNIIDTDNNPIADVTITIGASVATTDANGVFIINNASVKERFAYVKADKAGYIHGSRAVVPSSGTNKVTIMLLPETVVGTTSSGTSETISLTNGASVALEGNYIKEDGTEYSGNVNVIMHHLDPVDEDMENQMPGMLFAANADNDERMLQTLGMLAVELRGDNGEDLNLAEDSTAEINIPVDASLLSNAPPTIPLWYFDEFYGYWKEEGQATLVGSAYVGTISHFSFWNLDADFPAAQLCITVVDENGNALANQSISLTHFNPDYLYPTSGGITDDNGQVCGLVPQDETLELNVFNYDICGGTIIHTESIGPFSQDSSIIITIDTTSVDIVTETVTGLFNDCDGNTITNGYVALQYGSQQFYQTVENGNFEINVSRCSDSTAFSIEAFDYDNLQTTGIINYTFTTPSTDLGTLNSCDTVTEFIYYTIDNNEQEFIIDVFQANFQASNPNENNAPTFSLSRYGACFYMFGKLNPPNYIGTYDNYEFNNDSDTGFNLSECFDISDTNNNIIYNLTTLGDVGEYIDINFNGTYEDFQGNPHTINGVIHVFRDE